MLAPQTAKRQPLHSQSLQVCKDSHISYWGTKKMLGFMVGLLELVVSGAVTIVIDDQSEIGTAAGVFGSIRAAAGVLASKSRT